MEPKETKSEAVLNNADAINFISAKLGEPKTTTGAFMDALREFVKTGVQAGKTVRLGGLATFKLVERAARSYPNPQARNDPSQRIEKPAHKVVTAKEATSLRDCMRE